MKLQPSWTIAWRVIIYTALALFVWVTPVFLAYNNAMQPLYVRKQVIGQKLTKFLIVALRRRERSFEKDNAIPFRNSLIALYQKSDDDNYVRITPTYPLRSVSTGLAPPELTDIRSYIKDLAPGTSDSITYGYCSIPTGHYRLLKATLRADTALLITSWQRPDSIIPLDEPMVLKARRVLSDPGGKLHFDNLTSDVLVASRMTKDTCLLHGTRTKAWSHRDALGCMTLFAENTNTTSQKSDWHNLFRRLEECGALNGEDLGMALLPSTTIIQRERTNELSTSFTVSEIRSELEKITQGARL